MVSLSPPRAATVNALLFPLAERFEVEAVREERAALFEGEPGRMIVAPVVTISRAESSSRVSVCVCADEIQNMLIWDLRCGDDSDVVLRPLSTSAVIAIHRVCE